MQQLEPTDRPYTPQVNLPSNAFHSAEGAFILPLVPLRAKTELRFEILSESSAIQPFHVLKARNVECLAFVSALHADNLGTGLLLSYPSWVTQRRKRLIEGELFISFRYPAGVYAFSALNKATLITTCHLSDQLHDFLTMM